MENRSDRRNMKVAIVSETLSSCFSVRYYKYIKEYNKYLNDNDLKSSSEFHNDYCVTLLFSALWIANKSYFLSTVETYVKHLLYYKI